jgi:hypothetical protein
MQRASRWVLAAGIAGSALAVGTVHTVTLCIVTGVLAVAAVLAWWGAEPMKARSAATLLLFTGIGLTAYTALQCVWRAQGGHLFERRQRQPELGGEEIGSRASILAPP